MDLNKAIKLLNERFPNKKITGYWNKPGKIIFNTSNKSIKEIAEPSQFVVTDDGNIYGTNPMREDISIATMKKIR